MRNNMLHRKLPNAQDRAEGRSFLKKKVITPVKNYGKNVVGGAKIVGGALKNIAKWPAKQIEKEWRGEDEAIEEFKKKQKKSGWTK